MPKKQQAEKKNKKREQSSILKVSLPKMRKEDDKENKKVCMRYSTSLTRRPEETETSGKEVRKDKDTRILEHPKAKGGRCKHPGTAPDPKGRGKLPKWG